MSATGKIPRYDPNWDEDSQSMELHPYGDYVEFSDHEDVVNELQDRLNRLQKAVVTALQELQAVAE